MGRWSADLSVSAGGAPAWPLGCFACRPPHSADDLRAARPFPLTRRRPPHSGPLSSPRQRRSGRGRHSSPAAAPTPQHKRRERSAVEGVGVKRVASYSFTAALHYLTSLLIGGAPGGPSCPPFVVLFAPVLPSRSRLPSLLSTGGRHDDHVGVHLHSLHHRPLLRHRLRCSRRHPPPHRTTPTYAQHPLLTPPPQPTPHPYPSPHPPSSPSPQPLCVQPPLATATPARPSPARAASAATSTPSSAARTAAANTTRAAMGRVWEGGGPTRWRRRCGGASGGGSLWQWEGSSLRRREGGEAGQGR